MDPLLNTRRKSKTLCEKPWDSKCITNRYNHIQLRHHAAAKLVKYKPDAFLFVESACPSVRSMIKEDMIQIEDSDISSRQVYFNLSFEKEVENEHQSK